jgi:MFS family permease
MFLVALPQRRSFWLTLVCLGRFGTMLISMTYAASIPSLISTWDMSATAAGTVQTAFNAANAVALPLASYLADLFGARRVLLASAWLGAAAALGFALFARSHDSALLLFGLVGISQAGTHTPAIMLIAGRTAIARRGAAIGWLLASSSLGYVGSLALSGTALALSGYQMAFLACAIGSTAGAILFTLTAFCDGEAPTPTASPLRAAQPPDAAPGRWDRSVLLLNIGYVGHSWELLGMFAWAPAFVTAAAAATAIGGLAPAIAGAWLAGSLHLAGFAAALTMGRASDRLGRRRVLIALAAAGAACSLTFGWTIGLPVGIVALFVAIYGFSAFGDSPVLSTAMTEAVAPGRLGRALAIRSILGFGAGAISPLAFGMVLDLTNETGAPPTQWGWAFVLLGLGGALATVCAWFLPKQGMVKKRMATQRMAS